MIRFAPTINPVAGWRSCYPVPHLGVRRYEASFDPRTIPPAGKRALMGGGSIAHARPLPGIHHSP